MELAKIISRKLNHFFESKTGAITGLVASIGAFLALTLTRLSSSSIWFDESYSAYLMRYNWADLTHYTAVDVHPPFYYYLLKLWSSLFGTSPAALRSMSILFGVIALVLLFLLIKKLFSRRSAVITTFLVAVSPLFVRYGIEARMYMVVVCIALAATLVLLRALQSQRQRDYLIYGGLVALGMYTHYFTIVIWLSHWLYRYIYLKQTTGLRRQKLAHAYLSKNWLISHAVAIGLFLPWLPIAYSQFTSLASGYWIPAVTVNTPSDLLASILFYLEGNNANGWFALAAFVLLAIIIKLFRQIYHHSDPAKRLNLSLVTCLALAPPVFLFLLSLYPFKSVFVDRYLLTSAIFAVVIMGLALDQANLTKVNRKLVTMGALLLVGCFVFGISNVYRYGNYNRYSSNASKVTMTGELIQQISRPPLAVAGAPIIAISNYGYYEAAVYETSSNPVYFLMSSIDKKVGSLDMESDNKFNRGIDDINNFTDSHHRIWLIDSTDDDHVNPPVEADASRWHQLQTISVTDPISGANHYKATAYQVD